LVSSVGRKSFSNLLKDIFTRKMNFTSYNIIRHLPSRVARWHIFKPKIQVLDKFWRVLQRKMLVYFCPIGIMCGHLVYFVAIGYILWLFGIFFPVWVCCTKKNLATLLTTQRGSILFMSEAVVCTMLDGMNVS
jgi:hypothetical protein